MMSGPARHYRLSVRRSLGLLALCADLTAAQVNLGNIVGALLSSAARTPTVAPVAASVTATNTASSNGLSASPSVTSGVNAGFGLLPATTIQLIPTKQISQRPASNILNTPAGNTGAGIGPVPLPATILQVPTVTGVVDPFSINNIAGGAGALLGGLAPQLSQLQNQVSSLRANVTPLPISSLLGSFQSDLSQAVGSITAGLPVSSAIQALQSDLSQAVGLATALPISSALAGLQSGLSQLAGAGFTAGLPVSSIVNGLQADLSQAIGTLPTTPPLLSIVGQVPPLPAIPDSLPLTSLPTAALPAIPPLLSALTTDIPVLSPVLAGATLLPPGIALTQLPGILSLLGSQIGDVAPTDLPGALGSFFSDASQVVPTNLPDLPGVLNTIIGDVDSVLTGLPNPTAPSELSIPTQILGLTSIVGDLVSDLPNQISSLESALGDIPLADLADIPTLPQLPTQLTSILSDARNILSSGIPDPTLTPSPQLTALVSDINGVLTTIISALSLNSLPQTIRPTLQRLSRNLQTVLQSVPNVALSDLASSGLGIITQLPNLPATPLVGIGNDLSSLVGQVTGALISALPVITQIPAEIGLPLVTNQAIGDIGLNLPIVTQVPGILTSEVPELISSILAGLGIGSLPSNVPIPSLLSGLENGIPSILSNAAASLTTKPPLPTKLPLPSELPQVVSSIGLLPTGRPASSVLSEAGKDVSSLLSQLTNRPQPTLAVTSQVQSFVSSLLGDLLGGLGGVSTLLPSRSFSIPSISLPPVSTPTIGLSGVTTRISKPSFSVPSASLPPLSITSTALNGLTTLIPNPTFNTISISLPPNSIPTIASDRLTALIPTSSLNRPSLSLPSISIPTIDLNRSTTLIPKSLTSNAATPPASQQTSSPKITPTLSTASISSSAPTITTPSNIPTTTSIRPIVGCPADNGTAYVSSSGQPFLLQCATRYTNGDISQSLQPHLEDCANSCGDVTGCTAVSFDTANGVCYYKTGFDGANGVVSDPLYDSAAPIDLSCPAGNGVSYTDFYGAIYQVLCSVRFPNSVNVNATTSAGGGVSRRIVTEHEETGLMKRDPEDATAILDCSLRCSLIVGCVAVTETDGVCAFISSLGPAVTDPSGGEVIAMDSQRIVVTDDAGNLSTSISSVPVAAPTIATVAPQPYSDPVIGSSTTTSTTTPTSTTYVLPISSTDGSNASSSPSAGGLSSPGVPGSSLSSTSSTLCLRTMVVPVTTISVTTTVTVRSSLAGPTTLYTATRPGSY